MIATRENLPAADRHPKTSQATISMPNGSHQQSGQHTRCLSPRHALASVCAKPPVDSGACLIDAIFEFSFHAIHTIELKFTIDKRPDL
jgi:hypothetical protein